MQNRRVNNTNSIEADVPDERSELPDDNARFSQVKLLARLMDSAVEIPGLRTRIGLDAVLGLIPGVGDIATSFVSLYILQVANRSGVSRLTLARMTFNIVCDWVVGSIPLAGDVFDVFWKSNQRNVKLLLEQKGATAKANRSKTGDWLFLGILMAILLTVLVVSVFFTLFVLARLTGWIFDAH
jgi:hypothetical protein